MIKKAILNCRMKSKNIRRNQIITFSSTKKGKPESVSFHGNGVLFTVLVFSTEEEKDLLQN